MIERPILFSTPMVKAILEGRKNQTRRMNGLTEINKTPDEWEYRGLGGNPNSTSDINLYAYFHKKDSETWMYVKFPFISTGAQLWVRETFQKLGFNYDGNDIPNGFYIYKADGKMAQNLLDITERPVWKPSNFMPRDASRIKLKITNIRVQRLEDLTVTDAINEGIESWVQMCTTRYRCYYNNGGFWDSSDNIGLPAAICSFRSLFAHINGFEVLNQNPWLWVIDFEKV